MDLVRMICCALTGLVLFAGGCQSQGHTPPPTGWTGSPRAMGTHTATIVMFGELDNPSTSSVRDRNIGPALTEAFRRTIQRRSGLDTLGDERLARRVQDAVEQSGTERERLLKQFQTARPAADYIVVGRVTDFYHTRDLHEEIRPSSGWRSKNEAVVAIDYQVIDLRTLRVVAADHVTGMAKAPDVPARDLYRGVPVGSVVFWDSPLGAASNNAIAQAAARVNHIVSASNGSIRVTRRLDERRVTVSGGKGAGLREGQTFYILDAAGGGGPVMDPVLRQPLMVRITRADSASAEAWLIGEVALEVDLRAARLIASLPPDWNEADPAARSAPGVLATVEADAGSKPNR